MLTNKNTKPCCRLKHAAIHNRLSTQESTINSPQKTNDYGTQHSSHCAA